MRYDTLKGMAIGAVFVLAVMWIATVVGSNEDCPRGSASAAGIAWCR